MTRILARVLDKEVENPFSIASSDVVAWFGVSENTAREWLKEWIADGFIAPVLVGSGKRVRNYMLVEQWIEAFFQNNASQFVK